MYSLADYDYVLPPGHIAHTAVSPHHDARIMLLHNGVYVGESQYIHLPDIIPTDRVIYFNNSKVLRSRIPLKNTPIYTIDSIGKKVYTDIGDGEIFFLKMLSDTTFEALVRPGKKWKTGTHIHIGDLHIECTEHTHTGRVFVVHTGSIYNTLDTHGELPLPPYIEYSAEKEKDYQTVFAHTPGSVAAPTASLHFTQELLDALPHTQRFVTLHVGLGTFRGIDTTDVRDYDIHSETIDIPDTIFVDIYTDRQNDKKICAIGTTVARTLESLPYLWGILSDEDKGMYTQDIRTYWDAIYQRAYMDNEPDTQGKKYIHTYVHTSGRYICDTTIYITPGYVWYVVDDLVTNFHLPKSSLLVLVASLLGYTQTMRMYQQAIADGYRFYSFGDGMYIQGG